MERAHDQQEKKKSWSGLGISEKKKKAWSGGLVIYLSLLALPFGVPMQSRHVLLPWHTPHLSLAFGPPHTAVQSALQSSVELALHLPHL